MSDRTLKHLVASVILLLLVYQVGTMVAGLFGIAWGILTGVAVTAVSFLTSRLAKAGVKNSLWYLLPTILFTILPIVYTAWKVLGHNSGWFDRLRRLTPCAAGFVLPMILLAIVYCELRKRTRGD